MSFDRQIDQLCTHQVLQELLYINSDRQTIRPVRAISSAASVSVRINGLSTIPSYGLDSPVLSSGSKQGPYNVNSTNNVLSVRVDGGQEQVATLPFSAKMTVEQMADILNSQLAGIVFSSVDNLLQFTSNTIGPSASIFVNGASTLGALVGIPTNREYRGRNIFPGWSLISDPTTVASGRPSRLVVFDRPLKGFNDFVEVDYVTVRQDCRRCGGLGVENDWRYGNDGDTGEVRDEALLIQEVLKICFTVEGSNPFHTWYGSKILEQIGQKISNHGFVQNILVQDVYESVARWQSIKKQQEENLGEVVSDREYPYRIVSVDIQQSTKDQTVVFLTVTIQNRSGNPIDITRGLKLPQPTDLLGSTVAQGVFRQSLKDFTAIG